MRCDQHTFWPDNKEVQGTCLNFSTWTRLAYKRHCYSLKTYNVVLDAVR